MKTTMKFYGYIDHEEGKLASMETQGDSGFEIPVNIFAEEGNGFSLAEGTVCTLEIGGEGCNIKVYASGKEVVANTKMTEISMIPMGTFSLEPDDPDFQPQPTIIFSGKVLNVAQNPNPSEEEYQYYVEVETLDMTLALYFDCDETIEVGNYIHGIAWLSAVIREKEASNNGEHTGTTQEI